MVKVSPDTAVVILDVPVILIVSLELRVTPVLSSPTMVIVELVRYELRLGPVIVKVSPDTAVVMPVAPANFRVSVVLIVLPEESSPTKVMPVNALKLVKLNIPDPLVTNTWLAEPSVEG